MKVTRRLEDSQWNKRLSLLAHRYLREFGLTREDDIIEKAWKTLELFCVGEEAEESLQVRTCSNWSTTFLRVFAVAKTFHSGKHRNLIACV